MQKRSLPVVQAQYGPGLGSQSSDYVKDVPMFSPEKLAEIRAAQDIERKWQETVHVTESEHRFTSTGTKLSYHVEAMRRFHETGYATPIVSHIMPTDVCNLECSFCSVGNRNDDKGQKFYGLDFEKINKYLGTLAPLGLKAVILSGGGEPTAYKDRKGKNFRDLIGMIKGHGLEIGLITNGTMLDRHNDIIDDSFRWIRVSLYPSEYDVGIVKLEKKLPEATTLGFSLVVAQALKENGKFRLPRDENELLAHYEGYMANILSLIQAKGGQYLRLTPDCHTHGDAFITLHNVAERLKEAHSDVVTEDGRPIVLHQHKMHGTPNNCYLGFFHPVLYADGLVYPCDSNILNDDVDRRFKPEYSVAAWDTVAELYQKPVKSLVNTRGMCPRCVFSRNNAQLEKILTEGAENPTGEVPNHFNFI